MYTGSLIAATARASWAHGADEATARPAWRRILRHLSRKPVLACADQAVVSGTSFLTLIMIARGTDAGQLGAFAIGLSVLGVALAIQHSLVSLPYSIQRHCSAEIAAEHASCCLMQSGLFGASGSLLLAVAALALFAFGAHQELLAATWALAAVMPFVLIKEFARDFEIARLRLTHALILDAAAASIQLSIIAWLGLTGRLSPLTAYGAIGLSAGIAVLGWLYLTRAELSFRTGQLRAITRRSWDLGKWLFLSRSAVLVQGYSTYWLSMLVAGAAVTGVYAACMSVVSFANPIMIGLYNFLVPRSVLAWKDGGGAALYKQAVRDSLLLGALMSCFFILVLFAGETMMGLLYPGETYGEHGQTIAVLAFATLVSAVGIPASNALASMERPRPIAGIAGVSAVLNVMLVWWLMTEWGLIGAAFAILAANVVGTAGRWIAFSRILRKVQP